MLAEVLVWKEMVILLGLKTGDGKIAVVDDLKQNKSISMQIYIYTHIYTCTLRFA